MRPQTDAARYEIIQSHFYSIGERNPPILTQLEDRWDHLNRAFAGEYGLHRYAKRFADHYDALTTLSGEQSNLALSIESVDAIFPRLGELSELTEKVDHHIAKLFELLSEIEVECFGRLAREAQKPSG